NDPVNLIASDGPQNASKGDKGPGDWMPPNKAFHCDYVAMYINVVDEYGLDIPPKDAKKGAVAKLGGEQRRLSFSFPDGRCVWAFSGRLEDPVDDHRVRVRLP